MYLGVAVGVAIGALVLACTGHPAPRTETFPVSKAIALDFPRGCGSDIRLLMVITLRPDGTILLDDQPIDNDDALLPFARAAVAKEKDVRVRIDADDAVAHGRVVHVLDLVRQAGIPSIALGTFQLWVDPPTG